MDGGKQTPERHSVNKVTEIVFFPDTTLLLPFNSKISAVKEQLTVMD
jgi:hypothetical protein